MICSICNYKKENQFLREHIREMEAEMHELRADLKWAEEDVEHTMEMLREVPRLRWYEKAIRHVLS